MSQFPKSGFLARAATSSAAARASLRSKPNASTVSSLSSSRRTSHSHPNPPTTSTPPPPPPAPASTLTTSTQSSAATSVVDSTAASSSQLEVYGPHLPGHATHSVSNTTVAGPSRASTSAALPLPIPGTPGSSSSTYVSIGVQVATSSSNVFGPASAPVSSASFASAMTTVAPAARRPFNFWPQAVVTASTGSAPTLTAAGYAAAAAAAAAASHVQTVASPLIGAQSNSSHSPTSSQPSSRPSPADIFLSSLHSDFDPSLPWSTSAPAVDWLSSSLASTRIQSSVSWEGRPLPASEAAPEPISSSPKRSRKTSSAQWKRPSPITFDTSSPHGENWSFSSNFHRTTDGSFSEGPDARGHQSHTGSSKQSANSSSHQHQNQNRYQHHQHQQGRSPPPHPNPYPSNNSTLSSTGALITRPPSSGSSSSSSSTLYTSSVLSQTSAAAASSNTNSAPLNGNGFGAPGGISARALSIPPQSHSFDRSFDPHFHFEHGAYGIPKRHPLSSMQRTKRRKPASSNTESSSRGAAGFFAAAANSLVGGVSGTSTSNSGSDSAEVVPVATPTFTNTASSAVSKHATGQNGTSAGSAEQQSDKASATTPPSPEPARPRGICQDGRIVHDRLRSVPVGEDAYFLREDALGVADGVGGWASRPGADPALFSRLLMHFCSVELSRFDSLSSEELAAKDGAMLRRWAHVDPVEILHCAWHRCVRAARREGIIGSSTALVAVLRGDELRIANVGDCVLLIIRQGDLLFRSTEQQHSFNFPVQLGMMGDTVESVAEELQRRKVAKEKAAAAAAADLKKDGESGAKDGVQKSAAKAEVEDADDEPVPDGVDYTIDGHGASASADAGSQNGSATSAHANGDAQEASGTAGSSDKATASSEALDSDNEESEVEWDEPRRDAGRWSVKVEPGDVIIIGSDGLVDNLFDEDILEEVLRFAPAPAAASASDSGSGSNQAGEQDVGADQDEVTAGGADEHAPFGNWLPADFSPQLVSEALCSRAKAVSEDSRALYSPFQQRAVTEGLHYVGGKHDDISVLVAVVGAQNASADSEGKLFVSQSLRNHLPSQASEPTST